MSSNSLTEIVQQVFANVHVVASFNNNEHIEFILVKNATKHYLIWLPVSLDTCMWFSVKMNLQKFIIDFQSQRLQNRITYILKHFIESDFHDIEKHHSIYLQKSINNGIYH